MDRLYLTFLVLKTKYSQETRPITSLPFLAPPGNWTTMSFKMRYEKVLIYTGKNTLHYLNVEDDEKMMTSLYVSIYPDAIWIKMITSGVSRLFSSQFRHQHSIRNNITWWRHQMETLSALLAICVGNSPITGEFPGQRPVTRSFDIFFICTRINGWVNNREAGDLRNHHAHYDVTVNI